MTNPRLYPIPLRKQLTVTDRIRFITHQGKQILVVERVYFEIGHASRMLFVTLFAQPERPSLIT